MLSSFVISIVIFFTINVVIKENDAESILNKTYSYDLQLVDETYFDANRVDSITPECIKKIENINGVSDVRPIYSTVIKVPYQEEVFGDFTKTYMIPDILRVIMEKIFKNTKMEIQKVFSNRNL